MKHQIRRKIISSTGSIEHPEMVLLDFERKLQNFDGRVISASSVTNPQYMDKCQQQICFWAVVEEKSVIDD